MTKRNPKMGTAGIKKEHARTQMNVLIRDLNSSKPKPKPQPKKKKKPSTNNPRRTG